ncbi:metal ABC transporter solute-binding protein, Zn/Mn family [Alienimonas californiensis]|uniref:Periplasmic zinc-binding protein TroA n=1 Tax=Alienimonas californiensis TaxID=2527989 RepID=A0A517P5H0_9PLAN|nr:zinc ABC transporter substrate-binding protein [Alienimonas californiensis]QDT14628.1 Periplasmic zinc-binding protein TroA precursor [Alienimonas californiensis]
MTATTTRLLPVLAALVLGATVGCGGAADGDSAAGGGTHDGDGPIKAVATTGMVADLVRNVGGEHVEVAQMFGAGVDPHLYKATRDDVRQLGTADMIFYSGLMLEGKMTDVLVRMARSRPVVAVTEAIDESFLLEPDDLAGHADPHVWMDVAAWSQCVDVVAAALAEHDPAHADDYAANAAAYQKRLADLDAYGKQVIGSIPAGSRVLVTSHDAFNYMGRAYGLDVQGVQGISTESEAGLQRVSALVDLLAEQNVRAVFVESSVPRKSVESLVEGARARGHAVTIGGELFSDAMGPAGSYEGTYVGMLDHNLTTVARALGGEAPAGGFGGELSE